MERDGDQLQHLLMTVVKAVSSVYMQTILESHPSMLGVAFVIRQIDMMLWGARDGYDRVKAYDLVEISKLASCRSGRQPYALYRCMFFVPRETCIIPQGDHLIR